MAPGLKQHITSKFTFLLLIWECCLDGPVLQYPVVWFRQGLATMPAHDTMLKSCAHAVDGDGDARAAMWTLEFDIDPFNRSIPRMSRPSSIGDGVKFLNRLLSGRMFGSRLNSQPFFPVYGFLDHLRHNGDNVMINDRITDPAQPQHSAGECRKKAGTA